MGLIAFLLGSFAIFAVAYLLIGRWLTRLFALSKTETTPAHTMRDGLDFEPIKTGSLLPQHFSAIAAAGPIVGPILAAMYFGWGPAWLWIVIGSILIGGIHDFTALLASVRHKARSIAEVTRQYMNPRAYLLFLIFIWFALIYVVIAFTDVTAATFVQAAANAETGDAPGPAVATSSIIYLLLAIAMGAVLRFTKIGSGRAKLIFLPLVLVSIIVGPFLPLSLPALGKLTAQQVWGFLLLGYCFFAALAPLWLLLQPRGELGGYFLYIVMGVAVLGLMMGAASGNLHIEYQFFTQWNAPNVGPLFPVLFITVACGACSGFHSIIASGTTSKQLRCEDDARPVGYGSMLMEGFLACITLCTVMVLAKPAGTPNAIYAQGISRFGMEILRPLGLGPERLAQMQGMLFQFALLCFATFVFDTLDACTRLARYIFMEMMGWKSRGQAYAATALSLVLPALVIALPPVELGGKKLPLWQVFWSIFGSSNQLLAALTLLGITVWLARTRRAWWLTVGPTAFMVSVTLWSLVTMALSYRKLWTSGNPIAVLEHVRFGIVVSLIALGVWLVVEAVITCLTFAKPRGGEPEADSSLANAA